MPRPASVPSVGSRATLTLPTCGRLVASTAFSHNRVTSVTVLATNGRRLSGQRSDGRLLLPNPTSTVFRAGSFVFYDLGFFSSLPALTCHFLTGCIILSALPSVALIWRCSGSGVVAWRL